MGEQALRSTTLPQPPARAWRDPRWFQLVTLSALLVTAIVVYDTGANIAQLGVTLAAALATQGAVAAGQVPDWRSPAITAVSLTLLLRTHEPLAWVAAGVLGIASKTVLRVHGKHLFNPACFAIVALLLTTRLVWVSPGQWGALAWGAAALGCAAGLVLSRARRLDMALAFLGAWGLLLTARCVSLGDPWTIPLHQMQSGALLVFAFFMVTDPRSTPDSRTGRILFAFSVAALAHLLMFRWQLREGLFYALIAAAPLTPLLDRAAPAPRFTWSPSLQES